MSDPGRPRPDWATIFDRAHRHLGRRLLLLAGIGAAGALLLLSGGLTANGTINVLPTSSAKKEPQKHREPKHHHQDKHPMNQHENRPSDKQQHATNAHPGKPTIDSHPKPPKCKAASNEDSGGAEYDDCPPRVPEEEDKEEGRSGESIPDSKSP